ncbi:unnamed protein product [Sphenostylis stenocarpa]|uniref:Uncharacterized protein n=1 Tax=Sphenostylis stenocarpa TaxID=92480 RepID=A0AA86SVB4_9FABA|nr:unnamed protein product [Sphenostylis stenocarpa]
MKQKEMNLKSKGLSLKMFLMVPAMNRSLNRENPDILIMMIAGKQIIRDVEEDKSDQREREYMGPVKPATQMSATAPNTNDHIYWQGVVTCYSFAD